MTRLNQHNLAQARPGIALPGYDRSTIRPGIVHLGMGAFHRAHMAAYIDGILAGDPRWGIVGANLRRPDTKLALEPQDYLYSLIERDAAGSKVRIIGSLLDIVDASRTTIPLIERMADAQTRIVSLTVTEKGYCHDAATGGLSLDHPDIRHDLAHPQAPRSAPGVIVAALRLRRDAGLGGFTVLSCDNLPGNGHIAQRVVTEFAAHDDAGLAEWIAAHVSFPSTMVDRIVPSTTDADRAEIVDRTGLEDAWPVVTEPFHQWVVEDKFVAGRPAWEEVGVQMTGDVEPFEHMKLRMLNGAHSTMAYLGLLAGYDFVSEAVQDRHIRRAIENLMTDEVIPTLNLPEVDLPAYRDSLLLRFANPSLNHRLRQIAMDGSQKLPQRILAPLRERLAAGAEPRYLALAVAAWIAQLHHQLALGKDAIQDPNSTAISVALIGGGDQASGLMKSFLELSFVFGDPAQYPAHLRERIEAFLAELLQRPVSTALDRIGAA